MLRKRDKLVTPGTVYEYLKASNGSVILDRFSSVSTNRTVGSYESIDSVYDGGFKPGQFRVNPVVIRQGVGYCTEGVLRYKGASTACGKEAIVRGPYNGSRGSTPTGTFDDQLASYALAKAYAKTKEAQVELFVMLGEFRETVELLRNPALALDRALRKAPRSGYGPGSRILDAASGSWLTWIYGVMPLIQDISSIIETAQERTGFSSGFKRKRARAVRNELPTVSIQSGGFDSFAYTLSETTRRTHEVTAVVYYRLDISSNSVWNSRVLGYSWPQLPKNLWELVTFSFIVDWIFDVGSWLANATPDPSVTYLGNCVSDKCVTTYESKVSNPKFCSTFSVTEFAPSDYSWRDERLERKVNLSLPALPVFNRKFLDLKNLLSSIALIWANLPRNWKRR